MQTYRLEAKNGYGAVKVEFEARNIFAAETMAIEWLKRNFIHYGWLVNSAGRRHYVRW